LPPPDSQPCDIRWGFFILVACYNHPMNSAPLKISDTKNMAENLLARVSFVPRNGALVVGLYGDLGAGKTTFMQFFGNYLGIKERMLSPTFVIEKIYKIDHLDFDQLIHIDAYRLENSKELLNLGWGEIVKNPRNIICVEWADKVEDLLPKERVVLRFTHHDEESRHITLENV